MTLKKYIDLPRLPLDGMLDLTYRCNNNCRHCWLWLPPDAPEGRDELTFEEIRNIVDQARAMGCQAWAISGGEPMLRPDFIEIFDYLTHKSVHYSLNTNGILITPKIAHLLTRKGTKMIALYGATAKVHDHVTRTPGSFEAAMRGIAYLKEAGAPFTIQIIPMRDNYHQYKEMLALARNLSKSYRVGASWLYFSACRSDARNREIAGQRLDPADVIALDEPIPVKDLLDTYTNNNVAQEPSQCDTIEKDDRLFASCIAARRKFHIDPYGQMSFCSFVKEPSLRYNLREGTFRQAWDEFIPSLSDVVHGGQEYQENCGSCDLREDCKWCGVYAYLEHGRFSAKIDYLCSIAEKTKLFKEDWKLEHVRYYQIAGVTIQVSSVIPIADNTFAPALKKFEVDNPGSDKITIHLIPSIPALSELRLGKEIYRRPPWAIYRQRDSWTYLGISPEVDESKLYSVSIFNGDHSRGIIFCSIFSRDAHDRRSLTAFTTDQILIARVLADRQACYLHASGIILNSQGLLFVGHSDAGKSTMMKMLKREGEILCDDRIIVRRWPEGFRIHGSWSHGELPDVSTSDAPLKAIMFLEQANTNELIPITDKKERLGKVLSHIIKPLETTDWWKKNLSLAGKIAREVPAYRLRFDKSGQVIGVLKQLYK
jgi:radical SAM protein with 4Fe4S-binding SPASM domain